MRKIKFRGYSQEYKRWFYGCLIIDETQKNFYIIDNMTGISVEVISNTVGQYTGLKDKNGKEIYEGDIFNLGDNRILYIVEWFDTGLKGRQNGNNSTVGLQYWQTEIEVIGNIYENRNLLEDK